MVYQWKIGSLHKTDPAVAADVLGKLAQDGQLNAEALVEASRPEDAPLHQEFEWDDSVAAEKWRCHQGRNIINALVLVDESKPESEPVRAFLRVAEVSDQYESTEVLVKTIDGKLAMIQKARRELQAYKTKYQAILEYCNVNGLIASAMTEMEKSMDHAESA